MPIIVMSVRCIIGLKWKNENLDPEKEPITKVIKTCIYGVTPSGNQAERTLRVTSSMSMTEHPNAYNIVQNDIFDDCISGEDTKKSREIAMEALSHCLRRGGFFPEGFTLSGEPPDKKSTDDQSVGLSGLKWYPKSYAQCR